VVRRNEVRAGSWSGSGRPPSPDRAAAGEPDALLGPRPAFRAALRGYDRLQVDDYVAWAETELLALRRANDDLLTRYGSCSAELEISRRLLACSPAGREQVRTSERVGEILRLAADEAARLTEAGAADADRLRGEARAEADARTADSAVCAWNHFENIPTFYNWNNRPR
jgi:cell division septum initiation protein DivIVA